MAIALAVIAGILALINEVIEHRQTGGVDWGHVALAVGVPAFIYAVVRSAAKRR